MRYRALTKAHRRRRGQGGHVRKLVGFSPLSIFLWLLFGLYWILNLVAVIVMPYCNYDLFWVGGWPSGTSFLQLTIWIVILSGVVMVLSYAGRRQPERHLLGFLCQLGLFLGMAAHVTGQYGWYYPYSQAGRLLDVVGPILVPPQELYFSDGFYSYEEPALPPEVETLLGEAREEIRTGPLPYRAYDIVLRTDESYELVLLPLIWLNGGKQYAPDYAYERALRACVADYSAYKDRVAELRVDDTIMYVENIGPSRIRRYRGDWYVDERYREKYADFFIAQEAAEKSSQD